MNPETKNQPATEDIDLLVLIERSVLFFRRYKWVFFLAIVLGISFGFYMYKKLPNVYKSRLILHSFTLSNLDYIQIVDNWNSLLKGGGRSALASELGCSDKTVGALVEIKGTEIQKVFTASNPNGFYIDVLVTDNSILDDLQKGIIHGLENTPFIKAELQLKKDNLTQLSTQLAAEIQKLDSSKSQIEMLIRSRDNRSSSLLIDIGGLNRQLIDMNEKLAGYKHDLQFATAVQVLESFGKFKNPAGPRLFVWLAIGLVAFLALAYIYALINSINTGLKKRAHSVTST